MQNPPGPLQTRPEAAPPQAASVEQPHRPVCVMHWGRSPPQRLALLAEHSVQAPPRAPVCWQAGRAGSGQFGGPSPEQATQLCVVAEQMGVAPPQSALARQPTQLPPPWEVSQSGVAAPQRLVSVGVQVAQAPVARQTGEGPPHSPPLKHARQNPAGEVADRRRCPRSPRSRCSRRRCRSGRRRPGSVAAQAPGFPAAQDAQRPSPVQTGVGSAHSASAVQLRQVCVPASQTGVAPLQSAAAMQVTHVAAGVLAERGRPVQAARSVAEQTPQLPPGWQAGAPALHSPSTTQLRQPPVTASHTGVVPLQLALDVQPTQVPVDDWHCGVAPPQAAMLVAEQAPQVPFGWQAGVDPPQSPSRVQPRQVFVVVSQIGLMPPHCEALVQETQVPVAPSQPATGPLHFPVLVEEQTPQTPLGWQAGMDPPQSTSDAQPRQACVAGLHTGVDPPHPALVRQPTQVPRWRRRRGRPHAATGIAGGAGAAGAVRLAGRRGAAAIGIRRAAAAGAAGEVANRVDAATARAVDTGDAVPAPTSQVAVVPVQRR